jgi:hypothetical protein
VALGDARERLVEVVPAQEDVSVSLAQDLVDEAQDDALLDQGSGLGFRISEIVLEQVSKAEAVAGTGVHVDGRQIDLARGELPATDVLSDRLGSCALRNRGR